ncbi:sulfate respiration complex hexadecaheme cytochrome HmcA [Desulfohalobium retbaense]|uniref:Cytochrome c class III n=1 Tax=Desulfohalobium retbaense (strain ATCC 49708 / DSM 5692 / JCM 16813 / HR100) TaxID=485915 RepID=C8X171_DESRD|nr:cytochrome c3 family protein [Desulfohalobium retbaense]ACV68168.1 cytochrome c class III [Desulfohalobium retbaense DSM 5692]
MRKGKLVFGAALACACAVLLAFQLGAEDSPEAEGPLTRRPDVIRIDTMQANATLQLPPVTFKHDAHTEALAQKGQPADCTTCHAFDEGQLDPAMKNVAGKGYDTAKKVFHDTCIGCHTTRHEENRSTGPLDGQCRSCHVEDPQTVAQRQDGGFKKVLHARHVASKDIAFKDKDKNCGSCHHKYDEAQDKLIWAEGEEGTCRYCHGETTQDDVRALPEAAHTQCLSCHRSLIEKDKESGPLSCQGCHGEQGRKEITENNEKYLEKLSDGLPRLERGQPDHTLLFAASNATQAEGDNNGELAMKPVAFNHKAHEQKADTCRECHHAAMDSCQSECHTLTGAKKGEFIRLEQAMHEPQSERSCVGCHAREQQRPECAGCHDNPVKKPQQDSCAQCHAAPTGPDGQPLGMKALAEMPDEKLEQMAAASFEARPRADTTYAEKDIPEEVTIKVMADEYKPATFPHRKIVNKLMEGVKDSGLATAMHSGKDTICSSCHHNSPASKKPPKCASCHGKPFDPNTPLRPGLKAAYHQQCMGCHTRMELEKPAATDCASCHPKKDAQ